MIRRTLVYLIAVAWCCSFPLAAMAQPAHSRPQVTAAQVQQNPLTLLQQFTVADLENALADAKANNDVVSAPCYQALIPLVESANKAPAPGTLGVFTALQKARDAKAALISLNAPNGPLAALNVACAPLVLSVQNTLLALGVGTGIIISGPAGAGASIFGAIQLLLGGLKL